MIGRWIIIGYMVFGPVLTVDFFGNNATCVG